MKIASFKMRMPICTFSKKTNTQLNFKCFDVTVFMGRAKSKEPRNFSVIDMCGIISNLDYLLSWARVVSKPAYLPVGFFKQILLTHVTKYIVLCNRVWKHYIRSHILQSYPHFNMYIRICWKLIIKLVYFSNHFRKFGSNLIF